MKLILAVLFFILLFLYFFFRLPEDTPLRQWFDKNFTNIGHVFILLWVLVFFLLDPKLGMLYGPPLLLLLLYFYFKKKKDKGDS